MRRVYVEGRSCIISQGVHMTKEGKGKSSLKTWECGIDLGEWGETRQVGREDGSVSEVNEIWEIFMRNIVSAVGWT